MKENKAMFLTSLIFSPGNNSKEMNIFVLPLLTERQNILRLKLAISDTGYLICDPTCSFFGGRGVWKAETLYVTKTGLFFCTLLFLFLFFFK